MKFSKFWEAKIQIYFAVRITVICYLLFVIYITFSGQQDGFDRYLEKNALLIYLCGYIIFVGLREAFWRVQEVAFNTTVR